MFSCLRHYAPFLAHSESSSRARSQACITLGMPSEPSRLSGACLGAWVPLGFPLIVVHVACLVSPVTALGLLSGWTVSPSRAGIGSRDPQNPGHQGVWLVFMEWMKNGV